MAFAGTLTSRNLILAAVATVGLVQGIYMVNLTGTADHKWKSTCATWDRGTRGALSIHQDSAASVLPPDVEESLRLAREYCDAGRVGIAMHKYDVLRAAHAVRPTTLAATPNGEPFK
jgi:hypothetical protein